LSLIVSPESAAFVSDMSLRSLRVYFECPLAFLLNIIVLFSTNASKTITRTWVTGGSGFSFQLRLPMKSTPSHVVEQEEFQPHLSGESGDDASSEMDVAAPFVSDGKEHKRLEVGLTGEVPCYRVV
jgi:hypothetical protein